MFPFVDLNFFCSLLCETSFVEKLCQLYEVCIFGKNILIETESEI